MAESSNRKRSRSPTDSEQPKETKRLNLGASPESADEENGRIELDDGPEVSVEKDTVMKVANGTAKESTTNANANGNGAEHEHDRESTTGASAKGDSGGPGGGPPGVPQAHINMRCLIVTQDASIIIGRAGAHVNEIRQKSGAKVMVSESIPGNPERILNVGGPLDAVSKAFGLIVRRINDEPFDVPSVPGSRAVTIKFMIPNSRMGSVIGKAGTKIKEIQEASGARLNASEGMLPGSTERVLSVAGVADAIHIATYYIGNILIEAQERNPHPAASNASYRPASSSSRPPPRGPPGPPMYPPHHSHSHSHPHPNHGPGYGMQPGPPPPAAALLQEQKIYIPNDLVGCIIGKGGVKINEIRHLSQCTIKIMEPGAPQNQGGGPENERLVVVTGQPQNISMAVSMLYNRLEQEKQKKLGGPEPLR